MNFAVFLRNFDEILPEFERNVQEMTKCLEILRRSVRKFWKMLEISRISLNLWEFFIFHFIFSFVSLIASCKASCTASCAASVGVPGRKSWESIRSLFIRKTNEKMKWKMKISHKFWKFLAFSKFFSHFFSKSRDILSFPDNFCEIPENFYQIFAEKSQISSKNANEKWNFIFIPAKIWTVFCWNFEIWAVQKNANLVDLENPEKMSIWLLS